MKTSKYAILDRILEYCNDILATVNRCDNDLAMFLEDKDFKNSICMNILQIGELTTKLDDEYKLRTKATINWQEIKGLRNIFAHHYGKVKFEKVWNTAITDVPQLRKFCVSALEDYEQPQEHSQENLEL